MNFIRGLAIAAAIALCAPILAGSAHGGTDKPLLRLLEQIPAGAKGVVTLTDVAASRGQTEPLSAKTPEPTRKLVPYSAVPGLNGFNWGSISLHVEDGGKPLLGFSMFDIKQIAGWGEMPSGPVIIGGVPDAMDSLEKALSARKFETSEHNGHRVWHRGRDFENNKEHRFKDPFSFNGTTSQRFSLKKGNVLFSRGWPAMREMLDQKSSLAEIPDAMAIIRAGYALQDAGDLINAVLLPGQPKIDSDGLPPVPSFERYGLLLWQDGAKMTGAIVIPFGDARSATTAIERLTTRLITKGPPNFGRRYAQILAFGRRVEVIEISERQVLIFGFVMQADTREVHMMTFLNNPHRKLMGLMENENGLAPLIGSVR